LLKDAPHQQTLNRIRSVIRGQPYLSAPVAQKLTGRLQGKTLSRRKLEVMWLMTTGKSDKEIARVTNITQ
jgi:DNA-binding NarL/FixJ family response regulator